MKTATRKITMSIGLYNDLMKHALRNGLTLVDVLKICWLSRKTLHPAKQFVFDVDGPNVVFDACLDYPQHLVTKLLRAVDDIDYSPTVEQLALYTMLPSPTAPKSGSHLFNTRDEFLAAIRHGLHDGLLGLILDTNGSRRVARRAQGDWILKSKGLTNDDKMLWGMPPHHNTYRGETTTSKGRPYVAIKDDGIGDKGIIAEHVASITKAMSK